MTPKQRQAIKANLENRVRDGLHLLLEQLPYEYWLQRANGITTYNKELKLAADSLGQDYSYNCSILTISKYVIKHYNS